MRIGKAVLTYLSVASALSIGAGVSTWSNWKQISTVSYNWLCLYGLGDYQCNGIRVLEDWKTR